MSAPALLVLWATLLSACASDPAAQVDIHLTAGAEVIARAAVVVVETRLVGVDGDELVPIDTYAYGEAAPLEWPLHVAVAPGGGDAERGLFLVIEARGPEGTVLASAVVEGSFTARRRVGVSVDLADCCLGLDVCSHVVVPRGATDVVADNACTSPGAPDDPPTDAPVLLGPDNGATTGSVHAASSQQPTFSWEPVSEATHYELALTDACSVAAYPECPFVGARIVPVSGATTVTLTEGLDVSAAAPVGARWSWRVRGCVGGACGPWSRPRYLDVGRLANDIDGDGYSELIVGAPGQAEGGAVYLFAGGPAGPDLAPSASSEAPTGVPGELGAAVAVGDLDGDGFAEIVAGAPAEEGRVLVYRGLVGRTLSLVHELAPPATDGTFGFGAALAIADLDGDGYRDLIVGAPGSGAGAAYVYSWGPDGPVGEPRRLIAPGLGSSFGATVTRVGDLDGDGRGDVLIGAPGGELPVAHLFRGSELATAAGASLVLSSGGGRRGDGYGAAAAPIGDFDGDGRADLAVGADTMGEAGAVLLYMFPGFPERFSAVSGVVFGADAGDRFGQAIAGTGDLDGDDRPDVLVGAGGARGVGVVRILSSASAPVAAGTELTPRAPQPGAAFGAAVASVGDVDGDGRCDVVVAAPLWDGGEGRVFLFRGGPDGLRDAVEVPAPGGGGFGRLPAVR